MTSSSLGRVALASVAALLLLGSGISLVGAAPAATAPLSLAVPADLGSVQNFGDEGYIVSGGSVASAAVGGVPLDPGAHVTFYLKAEVQEAAVSGSAAFQLRGRVSGVPVFASGVMAITSSLTISQAGGPLADACSGGASACGELPVLFGGVADVQVTRAGATTHELTVLYFENPYFNPFGKPIVIEAADKSVVIAATYVVGTILWQGTQVGGPVVGVLGTSVPVKGTITLVSTESEDLVAGTAVDHGTVSLGSMTPSFLDATGAYAGSSYIPPPGPNADCSVLFGFPAGSGVCTITGFQSAGRLAMKGSAVSIVGSYTTNWTAPALAFSSTTTATVTF
jgi:hypothetical protein